MTHPIQSNIAYPASSLVNPVIIDNLLTDTNYSPKISYQITNKIAIGAGLSANNVSNAEFNFGGPPLGEIINSSKGWAYGWDAGVAFEATKLTSIYISYYSIINFKHLTGYSQQGSLYQSSYSGNLVIPSTYIFNVIYKPTRLWTVSGLLRYIRWSDVGTLNFVNTAVGNFSFNLHYKDIWNPQVTARYQFLDDWGVGVIAEYSSSPQSTKYRPIATPASNTTLVGGSIDYALSRQWTAKLRYDYLFSNAPINRPGPPPQTGLVNVSVQAIDLGFSWKN